MQRVEYLFGEVMGYSGDDVVVGLESPEGEWEEGLFSRELFPEEPVVGGEFRFRFTCEIEAVKPLTVEDIEESRKALGEAKK